MTADSFVHRYIFLTEALPALFRYNIHHLHHIQYDAQYRRTSHNIEKYLFLCGFGNVAVHSVGTGALFTPEQSGDVEAAVQKIESQQSGHLERGFEDETGDVCEEETSVDAALVQVQLSSVLALSVLPVSDMQRHQKRRSGHHDQL